MQWHRGSKRGVAWRGMSPTATRVLAHLLERTGTAREIAERIHADYKNVKERLNELHAAKLVYISAWRRGTRGPISPVYGPGAKPNRPKPAPLSNAVKSKRYRERLQAAFGEQYPAVRKMQRETVPGRRIVIDGVVAYQQ